MIKRKPGIERGRQIKDLPPDKVLMFLRAHFKAILCISALYIITWIGGYRSHSEMLNRETQWRYDAAKAEDAQDKAASAKTTTTNTPPAAVSRIYKDGPNAIVYWCFPVLPGVLIAKSGFVVGPLYSEGGIKLVIYYGWGSWASEPIWGWVS
jgi:hypothetical protein